MFRSLSYILHHPLNKDHKAAALSRYFRWQFGSRILKHKVIVPFVGNTRLAITTGMTGATGNLYCGLHEFEDMAFVIHALRPNDWFLDIGSNVGSYSVLAAGVAGASVIAFEPYPPTYHNLCDNMRLNGLLDRVRTLNLALGGEPGTLSFTTRYGPVNHIISGNEAAEESVKVPVKILDEVAADIDPMVMKIDVEGYETQVIRGGMKTLAKPTLSAILMEFNGSGDRYGYDEKALKQTVLGFGFAPHRYDPFSRTLTPADDKATDNVLFARNVPLLQERLRSAPKLTLNGVTL